MSLQTLQNNNQHITLTLKTLNWLPIKQIIDYKVLCLLTYKTLTNKQPTYLYRSHASPSHSVATRSSDSLVLFPFRISDHHLAKGLSLSLVHGSGIPYLGTSWYPNLVFFGAFSVIGLRFWNSLPPDTQTSSSLRLSLSLVHGSGIHYLLIPEPRLQSILFIALQKQKLNNNSSSIQSSLPIFSFKLKTHRFKIAFPPSSPLNCLPAFFILIVLICYALSNDT